jgi:hypothetical protein
MSVTLLIVGPIQSRSLLKDHNAVVEDHPPFAKLFD